MTTGAAQGSTPREQAAPDIARLEHRRRLSLRAAVIALAIALIGFPLGMAISGSETRDTIAGMCLFAAIGGLIAAPWIVRAWQAFMRRHMVAAAVAGRPDIRHIDGEEERAASSQALRSSAFTLAAFRDSGLVEAFESAGVHHILTGDARGVPFAVAEISLLDAKGYRMFGGVLASFRLSRPRTGLTVVTRDRGLLGNLLAGAGSSIERITLEDPHFERLFEVYGTDQVGGRVILTTTMLERLAALDRVAHAEGFACAFREEHLLVAFRGMNWRCAPWRILQPVDSWLRTYADWLAGLVDLPVDIVRTLHLTAPPIASPAAAAPSAASSTAASSTVGSSTAAASTAAAAVADRDRITLPAVPIDGGAGQVFSSGLWRLVGEGGMALTYVASGALFGGLALFAAWYGLTEGYSRNLFWYFWGMSAAGIVYGLFAVGLGLRALARLAWRWNAPLRTLDRR